MKVNIYPWQGAISEKLGSLSERLPHALLVHGPRGVGKLALGEHLAQRLLCEGPDPARAPCGRCEACRWFAAGSHPDFRRVEPEALAKRSAHAEEDESAAQGPTRAGKPSTEIRIEQIRSLEGFLNLQSHRGRRRVALVHPADDMNANSANALLKNLEEPPGSAMFVLISHRPARLPATVRSRCVAVPVGIPPVEAARGWLASQGVGEPDRWLALASGAPLRALELSQGSGAVAMRLRVALEGRDLDTLRGVNDREALEGLAEALQRYALDRAFATYTGQGKFGAAKQSASGLAWLRFARKMGRNRALARHPLNPRLFAGEMLTEMPKD
jgi:DNA polymerase-3 subunit delta'